MEFKRFALAMMGHFLASLLYVLRQLRLVNAVVDTSSILEHREELRELWEKRMMADDNQSSPSSTVAEKTNPKPSPEEGNEEAVVKTNSESETKPDHKLSNGVIKTIDSNNIEDSNANHIHEEEVTAKVIESHTTAQKLDIDHDNNNCADSLEEDNIDDYVEEKTYTSETSLVMKAQAEEVANETITQITAVAEQISEKMVEIEPVLDESATITSEPIAAEEVDGIPAVQESASSTVSAVEQHVSSTEQVITETETVVQSSKVVEEHQEIVTSTHKLDEVSNERIDTTTDDKPIKILEVPDNVDDDGDGFVRVEECLPKVDSSEDVEAVSQDTAEHEVFAEEDKTAITNGHEEHSLSPPPTSTPEPNLEEKPTSPEIEQFVKSGGLKRILPGVQKTEQPYSTCTTETKIAMEIREMREREEELRVMREQALLSPVVSPVPPSPRSPSPSITKESTSPVPVGCGYRVSSVFGHKGSTSPTPSVIAEEEKKTFKSFNKESAVEKEIRMARDREEELRKQQGLPPREDDSYVKPSQVKSSQVRVFGKTAGGNSVKQAATAKIQLEIEEQTQREMALRETGSIQTISQERTDAKVAKLKTPESTSPPILNGNSNGNSHPITNGNHTNGRSSPDTAPYKRGSPSPTGPRPATIFSQTNGKSNINMHKFIASKGKETTFTAPRNGAPTKEENRAVVPPPMVKLKRNASVESKIQQEIMEMKQREEELKLLHMNRDNENSLMDNDIMEQGMNKKNNLMEYENGNGVNDEDLSPRHNKLIAQWEQRIQKAES